LEVVVALEAAAEAIKGLAGLADPESDGVDCFSQRSHLPSANERSDWELFLNGQLQILVCITSGTLQLEDVFSTVTFPAITMTDQRSDATCQP
jgi:hypothetical protein